MQCINLATVSVDTTAGGTVVFSAAQARVATSYGMEAVAINPSVDCVVIDDSGGTAWSNMPKLDGTASGAVVGTAANSPWTCSAGIPTIILHRGGPIRLISTAGTATVKISAEVGP